MITAITIRLYCSSSYHESVNPQKVSILIPFLISIYAAMIADVSIAIWLLRLSL